MPTQTIKQPHTTYTMALRSVFLQGHVETTTWCFYVATTTITTTAAAAAAAGISASPSTG